MYIKYIECENVGWIRLDEIRDLFRHLISREK